MIGKLLLPLALGGGLLLLLSSSASAAPSAQKDPFAGMPSNLKQLAGQAQATNNPQALDVTAAMLEAQGFPDAAGVLRKQAQGLRAAGTQGPTPAPAGQPFAELPEKVRQLAGQAQATNDPWMLDLTAGILEAQGFSQSAAVLRQQAAGLRQQAAAQAAGAPIATSAGPLPVPAGLAPISPSFVPSLAPPVSVPRTLSPDLQKMIADAVQNGTPPVLTSTAFVLEKAGFPDVANDLRERAKQAAAGIAPPPAQDHPNAALDPTMPPDLALEVARQLQLQGDPNILDSLSAELRKRGFGATADQVEAKAQQIRAMLDAARTMSDINSEFKSPGIVQQPPPGASPGLPALSSAPPPQITPPPPAPTPPFASPPPTMVLPPLTVTASPPVILTPAAPLPVPNTPRPQPPAPEKSKAQILAETLGGSLNDLLDRYGSVPKARFKEDKGIVTAFQSQEKLTADGSYGPTTATHAARYISDVPPPFYWRKGAGQSDLSKYRSDLQTLALDAEQQGNTDRAERLRQSALKASLA